MAIDLLVLLALLMWAVTHPLQERQELPATNWAALG